MRPWNPHGQTFGGSPLGPVVPTGIRTLGPEMTPQQFAYAHSRYVQFCAGARLSVVPNPAEHGLLTDGSLYQIKTTGASTQMVVWTRSGSSPRTEVFSGVLFRAHNVVIVNKGSTNRPGTEWGIKNMTGVETSPEYARVHAASVPYRGGLWMNPAILLPGKMRYAYRTDSLLARYGVVFAHLEGELVGAVRGSDGLMTITTGAPPWYSAASKSLGKNLFPELKAPLPTPITIETEGAPTLIAENTEGDPEYTLQMYSAVPSRSGRELMYQDVHSWGKWHAADVVGGSAAVKLPAPSAVTMVSLDGYIWSTYQPDYGRSMKYRYAEERVLVATRVGDTYGGASAVYVTPQPEINASTVVPATWDPGMGGIHIYPSYSAGYRADHLAPPSLEISSSWTVPSIDGDPGAAQHRGTVTAIGALNGKVVREEKVYSMLPHYAGNSRVILPYVRTLNSRETFEGSVEWVYSDGFFHYARDHNGPHLPTSLTSPRTTRRRHHGDTTASCANHLYCELNDGTKLYLRKDTYEETGTQRNEVEISAIPPLEEAYIQEFSLAYTITREQRNLLVYDPDNDLLCYTECLFSASRSFSSAYEASERFSTMHYSNSGGGSPPAVPTPYLVVKCKGRTIRTALPYDDHPCLPAHFLPSTGISPYAEKDNQELMTSDKFSTWSVTDVIMDVRVQTAKTFYLNGEGVAKDLNGGGRSRGHAPYIPVTSPSVEYVKTPETGGAYMRVKVNKGSIEFDLSYLIDAAGIRPVAEVLPNLDIGDEQGMPF